MADYIYLLQTRLTTAQQTALQHVRDAARARSMTVFLVGGAVRDLTTGAPIRDLDVTVQGNAIKLKKDLQKVGGIFLGEDDATQALYFNFPGGVRLEVGSTLSVSFPKPGKPLYKPATILDDLRRRDFTANAMAISLNDGSFGLLMDPLNGVADLENRELRLVSNYGFIEDPARMIRATRFAARLGWSMEEKTAQRYQTGKSEGYVSALNPTLRKYELEEIFHEEDPLRVLRRLESEGWVKALFPAWNSKHVNESELNRLRDTVGQLEAMGIHPDPSPAYFPLLTAKLGPKDVTALKNNFARPGFVDQIAKLDAETKAFAAILSSKAAAEPSAAWKLLFSSAPEPILWLAHTTKNAGLQAKFHAFLNDWSQARTRIPYQLMQEMRIVPELPGYKALLDDLFFAIMDGKLNTPEAAKAFLEPFSPPAPPPPVNLRRRAVKKEPKAPKPRAKKAVVPKAAEDAEPVAASTPTIATTVPASVSVPKSTVKSAAKPTPVATKPAPVATRPAPKTPPVAVKKIAVKAVPPKATAKPAVVKKAVVAPAKKSAAKKQAVKESIPKKVVAKTVVKGSSKPAAKKPSPKAILKPVVKKASKPTPKKVSVSIKKSTKTIVKKVAAKVPAQKTVAKVVAKKSPKTIAKKVVARTLKINLKSVAKAKKR